MTLFKIIFLISWIILTIHLTQIFLHMNLEESPNSLSGDSDEHPRVFQMDDLLSHLDKLFNYQIRYVIKSTCGWSFELPSSRLKNWRKFPQTKLEETSVHSFNYFKVCVEAA